MASYTIHEGSVQVLGDTKVGFTITVSDEVNGKPDLTHYHEVESVDPAVIEMVLLQLAQDYEDRPGKTAPKVPVLTMRRVTVSPKVKPVDVLAPDKEPLKG